jgi:hypothetical protein
VIHPNTMVTIASSASQVFSGRTVILTVTETNTGDVSLTSPQVTIGAPLSTTLNKASSFFTGGDAGNDGILGVGETWNWTIGSGALTSTTTFTATGDGIDPLGNHVTWPTYQNERAQVTVTVINPETAVVITSSAPMILAGHSVTLTVTEHNAGDVPLTNPRVNVSPLVGDLIAPPTSGDNGNGILDVGETWSWTIANLVVNNTTTFVTTGHGTDPLGKDVTFPCYPDERAQVTVTTISPNTQVAISSCATTVYAGGTVILAVIEQNSGNVPLTNPWIAVSPTVGERTGPPTGGDGNSNGILDVGEIWWWTIPGVVINNTTTFTAVGHGTDPLNNDVTFPAYPNEKTQVTITAINPNSTVTISSSAAVVDAGGKVTLTVTEHNTGDVPLSNAKVHVSPLSGDLAGPPTSGDNGNGILDVGETWSWTVPNVVITANTTFIAVGHGIDPLNNDVTFPAYPNEKAQTTVTAQIPQFIRGDANGDGQVNMGDVIKVERIILGIDAATPGADANNDGLINMGDVIKIETIIFES